MQYHEAADRLQSLQRRRPKLGTETTARMLSHLGDPQAGIDCVQIAGSNGKGSTCRMLESVLRTAGLDVGVFTSPALNGFREQVRVNGHPVPKSRVVSFVDRIEPCLDRLRADDDAPTHFEVVTALALDHFGREGVDVAILEVGIGGRYDATSAVDPVASAVTSVSLEHTDLLGDTVEEIARDKAQVAPTDTPLVTGATGDALDAVRTQTEVVTVGPSEADVVAVENGMRSDVENEVSITGSDWALETHLQLLGEHQATNAGVAAALARQVADIDAGQIAAGLRKATIPGRFEIVDTNPLTVLDGSHNPGAMATLRDVLDRFEYDDLRLVFGAMSDKNHDEMAAALPPIETVYLSRPGVDRAADVETLATAFDGHAATTERIASVPEAVQRALSDASENDAVLVAGSLYAVAEARDRWTRLLVSKDHGRPPSERGALGGATFAETTAGDVDHHVLTTYLRPEQAERVAERLRALGGDCHRSATGAPGKFVATVLSGTVAQLRGLADAIEADGLGLEHVADRLRDTFDESPGPFDTDGTAVMGILNVTPDSFHDGGEYDGFDAAVRRAEEMVTNGADIVDVGGESTRPGAEPVSAEREIERVVPVVEALAELDVPISVDTRKAAVADAALAAGADIVNDVSGLSDPEMRFVVADHDASLVLMHSLSAPVDPDRSRMYDDVVDDVIRDLCEQVLLARRAGINREQIIVDPGCGFGKDADESFELVDRLPEFAALGCSVMVGHSRKSMFERVDCADGDGLSPTLAVTAMAAERGADVIRVHDVAENAAAVRAVGATTDT
ncbi:dihydropteroate synthase [Haloarcula nitratireducens]|uniref:Probable bifunctional folylpolyglutamate synthase/dihydropteroate synthase n=1 Tax=Haloarcula nitratireducens TaxID=2487749 RepID=A0AAW4PIB6_9EURY|nr:dihydropteroate synthase [Halomicroarcula nitratireducens]MBX0297729.1 dihydropteroate synthase [Halomicroarcula nitratireducens]